MKKEAKELYNDITQQGEKKEKTYQNWRKAADALKQAHKDYTEAQDGTDLKQKLLDTYLKKDEEDSKKYNKYKKEAEKNFKLENERGDLINKSEDTLNKTRKAAELMGTGGKDGLKQSNEVYRIASIGKKNW